MQSVQDPNQSRVDNLNNVISEAGKHFRNEKKAYWKSKIEEPEAISKIKTIRNLYRDINDLRRVASLEMI